MLESKYEKQFKKDLKLAKNVRECHIEPDWLLVYRVEKEIELLRLVRTGTHSDLFCFI